MSFVANLALTTNRRWPNLVFLSALVTGAWAWWRFAWPVLTWKAQSRHASHFGFVYGHVIGGTIMLIIGAVAIYIGWTRKAIRYHRAVGYAYLLGGSLGAGMGLTISLRNPHHNSAITVATGTLAVVWFLTTAMAFRAARNLRFDAHRQWMIRSYVLTWTFAGCRVAGRVPTLDSLGGGAALIWLTWVLPLFVCEVMLQWNVTSASRRAQSRAASS